MAISDEDHQKLKGMIRRAIEGEDRDERHYALRDAADLVGVTFLKRFVSPSGMKCNRDLHTLPASEK